jgi:transposase
MAQARRIVQKGERSMEQITVIGIDLAKSVFQLEAQSASGAVVWKKRLRRAAFMQFMAMKAPRCLVGFEACGGSHYWGRFLSGLGFRAKMMAPKAVKAYREGPHKNDGRDAHAAAEAASRASIRSVRIKSEAAQAVQCLMRVRTLQIKQMIQTGNQLRGLLNEFGIVLPKGYTRLRDGLAHLQGPAYTRLPQSLRRAAEGLCTQLAEQVERVKQATDAVAEATKDDESCVQLRSVPGLGPINAAGLSVALEAPQAYRNARAFAAALRLVPRQWQSADRQKLLGVAPESANDTRRHLVLAGQSLLTMVARMKQPPSDPFLLWVDRVRQRKNRNVAAVAVAAKLARIAWALMSKDTVYRPHAVTA